MKGAWEWWRVDAHPACLLFSGDQGCFAGGSGTEMWSLPSSSIEAWIDLRVIFQTRSNLIKDEKGNLLYKEMLILLFNGA
jgi:hypothetical protein